MGDPADPRPDEPILPAGVAALAKTQVALVVSAALVALTVLRVFLFARLELSTALAVLSVANRGLLLIATALAVAGYGVALTAFLPGSRRVWGSWARQATIGRPNHPPAYAQAFGVVLVGTLILPVVASLSVNGAMGLVVLAAGALAVVVARRRFPRLRRTSVLGGDEFGVAVVRSTTLLGLGYLAVLALTAPWLPAEQVTTEHGVVTGWVIGDHADRLLVVTADRQPVWVPIADVVDRMYCGTVNPPAEWPQMSISELVGLDRDRCDWGAPPGRPDP